MSDTVHLAVDLLGGDHGLRSSFPAALAALASDPSLSLTLFAPQALHTPAQVPSAVSARLRWCDAASSVAMDERPAHALRYKADSSMRLALDHLGGGQVDGVVSAGNTGALMAMGYHVLGTLPGIDRPAICSAMPTLTGHCHMLDLGANVDTSALQLHQFAAMGTALAARLDGIERPRVALLNIGAESIKGNQQVRDAAALLRADTTINFCGYIEGDGLHRGDVDVVVCDGFVGNVALKACEGTARLIGARLHSRFNANWRSRLGAWLVRPVLNGIRAELDPEQYNGAPLLGLCGVVVKAHGGSSAVGLQRAIEVAARAVRSGLVPALERHLGSVAR
ncbi:MAG TPA: phosphate acyltransferase PlsX [Spongiibacteraceae bacterium]|nr:phosphate acyltransferase PlsX [Spongiibacteraceae bacterium]